MRNKLRQIKCTLRWELYSVYRLLPLIIIASIASTAVILISWLYFGGPCRTTLFFKIPGGGITIAAYYVLWLIIFAVCGGEAIIIHRSCNCYKGDRTMLYHLAAHLCLLLWYPLFFASFSHFFALLIISAGLVLLVLEIKEALLSSSLIPIICCVKIIIVGVYAYINLEFLFIN